MLSEAKIFVNADGCTGILLAHTNIITGFLQPVDVQLLMLNQIG